MAISFLSQSPVISITSISIIYIVLLSISFFQDPTIICMKSCGDIHTSRAMTRESFPKKTGTTINSK